MWTNDNRAAYERKASRYPSNLTDEEWSLIAPLMPPPLALGQCFIATGQDKSTGFAAPIGLLLWAQVSDEVDRRLTENVGQSLRLRPDEWKCGETVWLVAAEACPGPRAGGDPRVVAGMLQQFRQDKLGGRPVKVVVVGEDGGRRVGLVHDERSNSVGDGRHASQ